MHFPDCTMGKEGDACDCHARETAPSAPADPEGETMIEARRVRGLVVFYPKRWRRDPDSPRGEWVPLVYDGANPRGFGYFHEAERIAIAYSDGPGDDAPEARWDVDAGQWGP